MADRPQGTTQEPGRTPSADRSSDTREQLRDRGAQVQERAQEMGTQVQERAKKWAPRSAIGLRRRKPDQRRDARGYAAGRDIGVTAR